MIKYEYRRYTSQTELLEVTSAIIKLTAVRVENAVGAMEIILPDIEGREDFHKCQIVEIWRSEGDISEPFGETSYFLMDWEREINKGEEIVKLLCVDANWLLTTRIVAYDAGTSQTDKSGKADDIMKEIIYENFGAGAIPERQIPSLAIQRDLSASETVEKAFTRRNVMTVCQELADAATEKGTNTYFDVVRTGLGEFEFRTYTNQRGVDHGFGSDDVRMVGKGLGNFEDSTFGEYHSQAWNYVYAGGQGEGDQREVVESFDASRIEVGTPFNRVEKFRDARNTETTSGLEAEADAHLKEGKPSKIITGKLLDAPGLRFGTHYRFGDVVAVDAFGKKLDCHISTVRVVYDGSETIDVRLKGEL